MIQTPMGNGPPGHRRTRRDTFIVLAILLALLFIALADHAEDEAERHAWSSVDVAARSLVQRERHPALDAPVRLLSDLASASVLVPLNLVVLIALWRRHQGLARLVPSLTLVSTLLGAVTKWLVARPRPGLTGYGFPSGHVLVAVVFYGAVMYLGWTLFERALWRWAGPGAAVLVILGVAYSRLYLDAHWLTDVLGALTGGGASLLVALAWVEHRWALGPPGPWRDARSRAAGRPPPVLA
jgi:membrane-associated phospholipid phosphatase